MRTWRTVVPVTAVLVWLGFTLLPLVHPTLQPAVQIAIAALVGLSAELVAVAPRVASREAPRKKRRWGKLPLEGIAFEGSYWVVPAGVVLAASAWLQPAAVRSWWVPLVPVALVTVAIVLQGIEASGPSTVQGAAHSLGMVLGFGLAIPAYSSTAAHSDGLRFIAVAVITAALTLVVLRRPGRAISATVGHVMLVTLIVTEAAVILTHIGVAPELYSGLLLLALYATSASSYALLDGAEPRAYVEIGVVTIGALVVSALVYPRG